MEQTIEIILNPPFYCSKPEDAIGTSESPKQAE